MKTLQQLFDAAACLLPPISGAPAANVPLSDLTLVAGQAGKEIRRAQTDARGNFTLVKLVK